MHEFHTLFNGGTPYKVTVSGKQFSVQVTDSSEPNYGDFIVENRSFIRYWLGDDDSVCLFQCSDDTYIHVGAVAYSFTETSPVVAYVGEIKNNDVPESFATLKDGSMLLFEEKVSTTKTFANPYNEYYRSTDPDVRRSFKPFTVCDL